MDPEHWIEYCLITITKILEINLMICPWRPPFMIGLRAFRSDSKPRFLRYRHDFCRFLRVVFGLVFLKVLNERFRLPLFCCSGFVTFWDEAGSLDPYTGFRILIFSAVAFEMLTKINQGFRNSVGCWMQGFGSWTLDFTFSFSCFFNFQKSSFDVAEFCTKALVAYFL